MMRNRVVKQVKTYNDFPFKIYKKKQKNKKKFHIQLPNLLLSTCLCNMDTFSALLLFVLLLQFLSAQNFVSN